MRLLRGLIRVGSARAADSAICLIVSRRWSHCGCDSGHRPCGEVEAVGADGVADLAALPAPLDETRAVEHREVLGDRLARDRHLAGERGRRRVSLCAARASSSRRRVGSATAAHSSSIWPSRRLIVVPVRVRAPTRSRGARRARAPSRASAPRRPSRSPAPSPPAPESALDHVQPRALALSLEAELDEGRAAFRELHAAGEIVLARSQRKETKWGGSILSTRQ